MNSRANEYIISEEWYEKDNLSINFILDVNCRGWIGVTSIGTCGADGFCIKLKRVFVFKSGHRDHITCSLLGGFSKPRTAVTQSLDSGLCSMLI